MECEKADRLNLCSVMLRGKWENIIKNVRFCILFFWYFCNMLCFLWNIAYCRILSVLNGQFKHLHKNNASEEIRFRLWYATDSKDCLWTPGPERSCAAGVVGSRQRWTLYRICFVNFCRLFMFLMNLCYAT